MRTGERSTNGCWTCKLRKKKCDEMHPKCSICQSLKLDCYGYGARPSWMVGGAQEKKIVSDMRLKVKETLSQKRKTRTRLESHISQSLSQTAFSASGKGLHAFDIASTASAAAGATVVESNADLAVDYTTLAHESYPTPATLPAETSDTTIKGIDQSSHSFGRVPLDEGEASLWMHYLDKTFPHQFPFYKPTASEGGRGWLFILVMQTEPLYHAVLSIAAYHQHYELLCENGEEAIADDCSKADEQLRRYDLALRKLQIYLNESLLGDKRMSKPEGLRLLACVVFLISLEVFKSTGSAWKIHLRAAASLLPSMKAKCADHPGELVGIQIPAWHFVAGTLAWYNTLACISPHPPTSIPSEWLGPKTGYLSLARIMGCEGRVISKIIDITILCNWKDSMQASNTLSLRELALRAATIEAAIEDEIKVMSAAIDAENSDDDLLAMSDIHDYGSRYISLHITRVFACATLTYLFAVISAPNPNLPEIQSSVTQTIAALRALPHFKFFCNLSWPLCITGCLATGDNQKVFHCLMRRYNERPHHFGSSQHILNIVEKCWELRNEKTHTSDDVDWITAMQALDLDLLLV